MTSNDKPPAPGQRRALVDRLAAGIQPRGEVVVNAAMLGSVGVGKTSLLASMYERFSHVIGPVDLDIRADPDTSRSMNSTIATLKELPTAVRVTAGVPGTGKVRHYRFDIGARGRAAAFTLRFTDFPGAYMLPEHYADREKVQEALVSSDVLLVAIDTPAMIEHSGRFHDIINTPLTVLDEVKRLLVESAEPRLIILTLLKAESYLTSPAAIDKLAKLVTEKYRPLLDHIGGEGVRHRVGCVLASVQTVGSVRLLSVDPANPREPIFHYRATGIGASYDPVDTDQPLRYLLRFVINKYRADGRPLWRSIWERMNGVDGRLVAAVDTFARGCKTTDGFAVLQDHPLLQTPTPWYMSNQ